jgi:hypothetical protein
VKTSLTLVMANEGIIVVVLIFSPELLWECPDLGLLDWTMACCIVLPPGDKFLEHVWKEVRWSGMISSPVVCWNARDSNRRGGPCYTAGEAPKAEGRV